MVENPGTTSTPTLVPYQAGSNPQAFGLMISPLKAAIPGNSERGIRIVSLVPNPTQDRLYHVVISPVTLPGKDVQSTDGANIQVKVGISYSFKVMVLAANPEPKVSIKTNGTQVTVTNTGNSYMSLRNGQLCDKSGNNCQALPAADNYHVLFAGNTWNFDIAQAGVVKFTGVYAQTKNTVVSSN